MISRWWLALAAGAVIGLALWLRTPSVPYLVLAGLATVLTLAGAIWSRVPRSGRLAAALLTACTMLGAVYQRRIARIDNDFVAYSSDIAAAGVAALHAAVDREARELQSVATTALAAPPSSPGAFRHLEHALGDNALRYRGVVLLDENTPLAWAGDIRAPVEDVTDSIGVRVTPFYVVLVASRSAKTRRAVATTVLHAEPPADRLAGTLDLAVTRAPELSDFAYQQAARADSGWVALRTGERELVSVRPVLLSQGEARVRLVERGRLACGIAFALAILALLGASWRQPASLGQRLGALAVTLAAIAIVPFNTFSNISRVFDPAVYFAPLGGPLTGSVAALGVTSALLLLACFAVARSRPRLRSRWPAFAVILVVASLGPFLLRDLARGITLPPRGPTPSLWLAWEVALFMAASGTLLVGAGAGRVVLGGSRGLSPVIAPALAALVSAAAVPLWQAPGRWPEWYAVLWIVVMAALALARRSPTLVFSVGVVAACGAATLMWGTISRKRVDLAQGDVAQLTAVDPSSLDLLERFANALDSSPPPLERRDLLSSYVHSPLAATGHPAGLASWAPGEDRPRAELLIAEFDHHPESERQLVRDARLSDSRIWRTERSTQGVQTLLAEPHPDGWVTTIVLAPRTLLIPEDPFTALIGLAPPATTEPPYDLTLTTLPSPLPLTFRPRWVRRANELHGDWRLAGATDSTRVHVEVELRGLDVLLPRGALIVLLDLLILTALWTLAAAADGGLWRWTWWRVRRWGRSYRGRLTVTLFAFFVIPAVAFAFWSYRRLQETDRESRELLIGETLRTVAVAGTLDGLGELSDRFDVPLLEYRRGAERAASDELYDYLVPVGRYLPRQVQIDLGVESEVMTTARPLVAGTPTLFGYRSVVLDSGERAVLAAPARTGERALDRERRDIGMLVLFVTSLGALAALWLSGRAARELERPVGALRRAALRIGRGERYPGPDERPAEEFVPVFSAFERMDRELAASRAALQEAHRRTEAVLRDVASGVVATDREGVITIANPGATAILRHDIAPGMTLEQFDDGVLSARVRAFLAGDAETEAFVVELGDRQLRGSLTRLGLRTGGAVLTLDDVTELARAQRVLAWGEMARQVAHEIKNPLTPIRLGVQHLRRARHDPRIDFERVFEQNAARILAEIDRLDEIARAFSRYGMAPAERESTERVNVAAVVHDVVGLERMGVSDVSWHLAGIASPVYAVARENELRDVLLNLLENARQSHARNVSVAVEPRDGRVEIVVRDDGDGIPEAFLARVFEPHFSTRTSGSGLGLAISRGLVTSWGGDMQVKSERGTGTEMRITLVTD